MKKLLILFLLLLPVNAYALTVNTGGFDRDWKVIEQCIQKNISNHEKRLRNARIDLFHSKIISPLSGEQTEYFGVITIPASDVASENAKPDTETNGKDSVFEAAYIVPGCMYDTLMWPMLFAIDSGTDRLLYLPNFNSKIENLSDTLIFESRGRKTIYMRADILTVLSDKTPRRLSATYSPPDYTKGISRRDHKNFVRFVREKLN